VIYLQDEGCEIDGIKIWGSPQTPEFFNWAFNCWRSVNEFMDDPKYDYIGKYWAMIPKDTDILLTHGPPHGIMDMCPQSVGCEKLKEYIFGKIKPKYHIFGHIHEGRGEEIHEGIQFINASSLDGRYNPIEEIAGVWDADNISDSGIMST
jgi:Icc-related predicted phosphoesterase